MISKLSSYLTKKLLSNGTIDDEEKELYIYGLFMLLSRFIFFIIACIFGLVLNNYYLDMIELCKDIYVPIAVCNPLFGKEKLFENLNNTMKNLADFNIPYHIINYDLSHAFFSDTFLLWIEIDSFLQPQIGGFLEKCSIVFCEALKRGIPLRGSISVGKSIMDEKKRIFLGQSLTEAAKTEPRTKWLGVSIGKSIVDSIKQFHSYDMKYLLPFRKHRKYNLDPLLSDLVLDWFTFWKDHENTDVKSIIESLNKNVEFDDYYRNCLMYIDASQQREIIWNEYLICRDIEQLKYLCEIHETCENKKINKSFIQEGIRILTSDKIMKNINYILNRDNEIWFDEIDKDMLSLFSKGFITINDKKISIDHLKSIYR